MNIEQLREYCLRLPAVTEDLKWGNNLTFCIADKMFLLTGLDDYPVWVSIKADDENFEEYVKRDNLRPSPYLGRSHWIMVEDLSREPDETIQEMINTSYSIIRNKLPKKIQKELPPFP